MLFFICNLIAAAVFACVEDLKELPKIVAKINSAEITRMELEARISQSKSMNPELFDAMNSKQRKQAIVRVLNNMIIRELLIQQAKKQGVTVEDNEIERRLSELKKRYDGKGGLKEAFDNFKITLPQWKEETKKNILIEKLEKSLYAKIQVSDDEILKEFAANHWKGKEAPPKKELDEHREHMRLIIQQRKWIENNNRKIWLGSLINASKIWRCSSEESFIANH